MQLRPNCLFSISRKRFSMFFGPTLFLLVLEGLRRYSAFASQWKLHYVTETMALDDAKPLPLRRGTRLSLSSVPHASS